MQTAVTRTSSFTRLASPLIPESIRREAAENGALPLGESQLLGRFVRGRVGVNFGGKIWSGHQGLRVRGEAHQ